VGARLPLLRENLKLTPEQRLVKLQDFVTFIAEVRGAGRESRLKRASGRPKDLEAIAELEALSEERDDRDRS
jgi:hypothetical protein